MATADEKKAEAERFAATRRAQYVEALQEERAGCVIQGKEARVSAIDEELKRVKGLKGRTLPTGVEA